jgi:hypothetical protein
MADYNIEQGEEEWWAHQAGNCRDWCPYCEEDIFEDQEEARDRFDRALIKHIRKEDD